MKYINFSMFLLSFTIFSIMTYDMFFVVTDLWVYRFDIGGLWLVLWATMGICSFATGQAHLSFIRMARIRNHRRA
jgi:hypothetical protein